MAAAMGIRTSMVWSAAPGQRNWRGRRVLHDFASFCFSHDNRRAVYPIASPWFLTRVSTRSLDWLRAREQSARLRCAACRRKSVRPNRKYQGYSASFRSRTRWESLGRSGVAVGAPTRTSNSFRPARRASRTSNSPGVKARQMVADDLAIKNRPAFRTWLCQSLAWPPPGGAVDVECPAIPEGVPPRILLRHRAAVGNDWSSLNKRRMGQRHQAGHGNSVVELLGDLAHLAFGNVPLAVQRNHSPGRGGGVGVNREQRHGDNSRDRQGFCPLPRIRQLRIEN